jgi:hypothetical protein
MVLVLLCSETTPQQHCRLRVVRDQNMPKHMCDLQRVPVANEALE